MNRIRCRLAALVVALACATSGHAVDIQKLTQDTQRMLQSSDHFTIVWWMPQAFWEAAMERNAALTPEARASMLKMLDDFNVFAITRARLGSTGVLEPLAKADLLQHARFEVAGEAVAPVSPDDVPPTAAMLLAAMKPLLGNMLGKFGQGFEMVVYPSKRGDKRLLEPTRPGGFTYALYEATFTWRLPLPSLLPAKVDPRTGQEFPGDYVFNPYTAEPLVAK